MPGLRETGRAETALRLLALALVFASSALAGDPPDPRRILHLLQYVARDYAEAAASGEAGELAEQRGFVREAARQLARLPDGPARAPLAAGVAAVLALVEKTAPVAQVQARLEEVAAGIARAYPATLVPPATASRERGRMLYARTCATCHGATGNADGPAVAEMHPKPIRFTDPEKMARLSPAQVHDTIAYGVTGTPMPSFESVVPPEDRWDLAFYVFTLRPEAAAPGALPARVLPLRELAVMSDGQLEDMLRAQGVPAGRLAGARKALRDRATYGGDGAAR